MLLPKGYRLNNGGNIERAAYTWHGESTLQDDPRFIRFETPQDGLRALMRILLTYHSKYGLDTIKALISRWAPPNENDTASYIADVSKHVGIDADLMITDMAPYLIPLAQAIVYHENGAGFDGHPIYWYDLSVFQAAQKLALS